MKHLSEDQLVLYHYRDAEDLSATEQHLAACDACRDRYSILRGVLAAVDSVPIPERTESYSAEVWRRLYPALEKRNDSFWSAWLQPRRWAAVGAMAALCLIAFMVGRVSERRQTQTQTAQVSISGQARERILLVAVDEHLERSQMVLIELANTSRARQTGAVDIAPQRRRAQDLVEANRLYRQAAAHAGEAGIATVLDDLERFLIEIAHSPSKLSSREFDDLRRRIEADGILFKVRVIDSQMQQRENAGPTAGNKAL